MYFLGLGLILLLLKYLEIGFFASWSWYAIGAPFALAALWWAWADSSGYTKRRAMDKMEKRRRDRIERQKEALGVGIRKRR
ncbi:MAG: TIGR04438 family Trp-rich protein [Curvibacter sp.]|nr:MAG: TIGR04438 family Trp-rich protein [Curvibacter sp.]